MRSLPPPPMRQQTRTIIIAHDRQQPFRGAAEGADATVVVSSSSSKITSKARIRRTTEKTKVPGINTPTAAFFFLLLSMTTMMTLFRSGAGERMIMMVQAFSPPSATRPSRRFAAARFSFQRTAATATTTCRPRPSNILPKTRTAVSRRFLAASAAAATSKASKAANADDGNNSKTKYLVIVESPAKCATIEKILNEDNNNNNNNKNKGNSNSNKQYQVVSCMGHIRNLPKRNSKNNASKSKGGKKSKSDSQSSTAAPPALTRFPYKIAGIDLEGGQYRPEYVVMDEKWNVVRDLQRAVANADAVLLATDPDREGEAMAWHLAQVLDLEPAAAPFHETSLTKPKNAKKKTYQRIRFTEITPRAIREAVREGTAGGSNADRDDDGDGASSSALIHANLVTAQETRRVLDRLAGFTVSPVLWKKIAPGLSAGRVQSVGLQLIVQRERQRLAFEPTPYYDATAIVASALSTTSTPPQQQQRLQSCNMTARLVSINGTAVANAGKDFTSEGRALTEQSKHKIHLRTEADAQHWIDRLLRLDGDTAAAWRVHSIQSRRRTARPPRPYKTSTLQQEAVRKLGLSVQVTMRAAQQLYEAGCISYMRTDSTVLSRDAERTVEATVANAFGAHMLASEKDAAKNDKRKKKTTDQEAHEAIRPAIQSDGTFLTPDSLPPTVAGSSAAFQVYRMIYQRTLAHRMPPLITNQTQVVISGSRPCGGDDVKDELLELHFRVSGSVVVSPGYTLAYGDDSATNGDDDESQRLPPLQEGQVLQLHELFPVGHETQPPPRYTEASFVKELEALGVGRPSTYAKIVQILRDRAYVGSPIRADSDSGGGAGNRRSGGRKTPSGPAISALRAAGGVEFTGGGGTARGPLVPSLSAFVVCALLEKYCPTYVDPNFTARMEDRLDQIASGGSGNASLSVEDERVAYLDEFYAGEVGLAAQIKRIEDTVKASDARRAVLPALMTLSDSNDAASLKNEEEEEIGLFIGPWGPYVQQIGWNKEEENASSPSEKPPTAQLPPSMAADISTIKPKLLKALLETKQEGGTILGQHPEDGRNIRLKTGRYGAYLQWGDDGVEGTTTHSLPRSKAVLKEVDDVSAAIGDDDNSIDAKSTINNNLIGISLEEAIGYVGLPRTVSTLNDLPIVAAIGPYGPYLKYDKQFTSLNKSDGDVLTIGAKDAELLVTERIINKSSKLGRGVLADLGEKDGSKVTVKMGRFGVYLNWKSVNAKLPADYEDSPESIPLEEAWLLIQEKAASDPKGGKMSKTKKSLSSPDLPPAPKRPLSAYLHFCAAKRAEVAESTKTLGEVSKKLAALWANTGPEERKKYEELAAAGKLEYEVKKETWKSECDKLKKAKQGKKTSKAKSGRKTEVNKPKRPKSAYLYFCATKRSEVAETVKSLGDISKELARQWAETTDRTEYDLLAEADKKRYEEEMNKYRVGDGPGAKNVGNAINGSSTTTSKKSSRKPQKAPSAYMLFCREFRPTIVDDNGQKLPLGETTKRLAAMWRECDEDTKSKFQALAMEEKDKILAAVTMVCSVCLDDDVVLVFNCRTKKCDYGLCEPCVKLALVDSSGASCRDCPSCKAPTARYMVESVCGVGAVREVERDLRARVEHEVQQENMKKQVGREMMSSYEEKAHKLYLKLSDSLNMKCPRCCLVFLDYSGCNALNCGNPGCRASFCAICLKDCGGNAHPHARTHGNLFDKALFEQAKSEREKATIDLFLSEHADEPFEVKELVRIKCEKIISSPSRSNQNVARSFLNKAKSSLRDAVKKDRLSVLSESVNALRTLTSDHMSPRNAIPDDYKLCLIADAGFKCNISLSQFIDGQWKAIPLPKEDDESKKDQSNVPVVDALINIRCSLLSCSLAFAGSRCLYQTSVARTSKGERTSGDEITIKFTAINRETGEAAGDGLSLNEIRCSGIKILGLNQNQRMLLLEQHVETSTPERLLFEPLLHFVGAEQPGRLLHELSVPAPETFGELNSRQQLVAHPLSIKTAMECAGPPGTGKTKVITELVRAILYCTDYNVIILSERNGAVDAIAEKICQECINHPQTKRRNIKDFVLWKRVLAFGSAGMGPSSRLFTLEEKLKMHPELEEHRRVINDKRQTVASLKKEMLQALAGGIEALGPSLPQGSDADTRSDLIAKGREDDLSSPLEIIRTVSRALDDIKDLESTTNFTENELEEMIVGNSSVLGRLVPIPDGRDEKNNKSSLFILP